MASVLLEVARLLELEPIIRWGAGQLAKAQCDLRRDSLPLSQNLMKRLA